MLWWLRKILFSAKRLGLIQPPVKRVHADPEIFMTLWGVGMNVRLCINYI